MAFRRPKKNYKRAMAGVEDALHQLDKAKGIFEVKELSRIGIRHRGSTHRKDELAPGA
jgi:hypothetical protein